MVASRLVVHTGSVVVAVVVVGCRGFASGEHCARSQSFPPQAASPHSPRAGPPARDVACALLGSSPDVRRGRASGLDAIVTAERARRGGQRPGKICVVGTPARRTLMLIASIAHSTSGWTAAVTGAVRMRSRCAARANAPRPGRLIALSGVVTVALLVASCGGGGSDGEPRVLEAGQVDVELPAGYQVETRKTPESRDVGAQSSPAIAGDSVVHACWAGRCDDPDDGELVGSAQQERQRHPGSSRRVAEVRRVPLGRERGVDRQA